MSRHRFAVLYGGPSDGSRIEVDRFRPEIHISVMEPLRAEGLRGDEPFDPDAEMRTPTKTGMYLAAGAPIRLREWTGWRAPRGWDAPDHEVCLYIYVGCRP